VNTDQWQAVDESAGLLYSHSVTDLFNFLNSISDAFWSHARNLQGFGVADALPSLLHLLGDTLSHYGRHVAATVGLDVLPLVFPTKEVKLKQAKAEPTDKDRAKAFVKGLFNKKDAAKDADKDDGEGNSRPADLPQRGLVVQSLSSLCVRLCCLEAIIDHTEELSENMRAHMQALANEYPVVAPNAGEGKVRLDAAASAGVLFGGTDAHVLYLRCYFRSLSASTCLTATKTTPVHLLNASRSVGQIGKAHSSRRASFRWTHRKITICSARWRRPCTNASNRWRKEWACIKCTSSGVRAG